MWIFVKIKKQLQLKEKIISYSENFSSAYIKEGKFIFQNGDEADAITSRFTQPQCRWEVHLQLNSFAFSLSGGERWEAVHLFNKDSLSDYHEPVSLGSEETTMNKRASSQHLRRIQGSRKGDSDLSRTWPSFWTFHEQYDVTCPHLSQWSSVLSHWTLMRRVKLLLVLAIRGACLLLLLGQTCPGKGHSNPQVVSPEGQDQRSKFCV